MDSLLYCSSTLLIVLLFHAFVDGVTTDHSSGLSGSNRAKRQSPGYDGEPVRRNEIRINFINKSGRRAKLFQSNYQGYEIYYRFLLRPNEPKTVAHPPDGTFWIAYDFLTNRLLLINGRTRLESAFVPPGLNFDAKIQTVNLRPESVGKGPIPPQFVETLVVIDTSMWKHHGEEEVVPHVNTIMNMVTRVFYHRSLKVPIFISVVGIVVMKEKPEYYRIEPNRPQLSVSSACRYAHSVSGNISYDFTLILTRENIGPEGYASMFTMCTRRSCALVRENGPDSAFVIAHEMAHALGIDHDENDGCIRDNVSGGNIMVKKLFATSANYQWSRCSQRAIRQNIKYFKCLRNKPILTPSFAASMNNLPGEIMELSQQCKHYIGMNATACTTALPQKYPPNGIQPLKQRIQTECKYLWCRSTKTAMCKPIWWHSPLEGTTCRKINWCIRGKCVKKIKRVLVNGGWSNWTQFQPQCKKLHESSKMLWMVQSRNRTCDNPRPRAGGKKCVGIGKEHRIVQPASNRSCKPYSLLNFLLNSGIDKEALYSLGCQSATFLKKTWLHYTAEQQKTHIDSLNMTCNFEERGGCGWKSSPLGVKHWMIGRGKTPSAKTGPSNDSTYGNSSGHYLFFEASWLEKTPRLSNGVRVILESPLILSSSMCLSFSYHMYGKSVRGLEVYVRNGKHRRKMWYKKGEQGNKWHRAEIDLALNIEYKVTIEAIRGSSYHSDIAIDDISVRYGMCNQTIPVKDGCSAVCQSSNEKSMFRTQLQDGTPCTSAIGSNSVCFKKRCQPVNCNGIIGSTSC